MRTDYNDAEKRNILIEAARVGMHKTAKSYNIHVSTLYYWKSKLGGGTAPSKAVTPKKKVIKFKNIKKKTLKEISKPQQQVLSKAIIRKINALDKSIERSTKIAEELKSMIDFS